MSQQQAQACIEKMKVDEAFRAKVMAVEDVAVRVKLINAEGFDCTEEELKAESQRLSDDDLNKVAGGCGIFCSIWF
jgi:predicted ribosomally synthesized peptide with nif11-like leader